MTVLTSFGWRDHVVDGSGSCWCGPRAQQVLCMNCGELHTVLIHKGVTLLADAQPRMTVFSR